MNYYYYLFLGTICFSLLLFFILARYSGSLVNFVLKSPFGLGFLITQFSISITHNLKIVGLIVKNLFGKQ